MIKSKRWEYQGGGQTSPAGAVCSSCSVDAELERDPEAQRFRYRCPRCGATAAPCPLVGFKGCVLVEGHGDRCQSRSGSSWYGETREAHEARRAQRRALDRFPA